MQNAECRVQNAERRVQNEGLTAEEIVKSLRVCAKRNCCPECIQYDDALAHCADALKRKAAGMIEDQAKRIRELEGQLILRQNELLREREKHRWIPVEERLPEISEFVLTLGKEGVCEGCWPGTGWWRLTMGISTKEVTHWMPMPKGAEEAGQA